MSEDLFQGFRLGDLQVEPFKGQVTGSYGSRHMSPKAVEVLLRLAKQPGEVISRNVLLDEVWGAGQGTSEALGHAVSALRYALDDHAANPRFIETLPKRGYRLLVDPAPLRQSGPAANAPPDEAPAHVDFFSELKRRGVMQTGLAYIVVGWLVLQVVDVTFEPLMLPRWFGTFIAVLVIAGFPIALLLAWFIEIVEGRAVIDRRTGAARPKRMFSRPYAVILGALALASLGVFAYDHYIGLPDTEGIIPTAEAALEVEAPIVPNSIAVLRFLNIDGSEDTEIFSNGLAEDVMNRLAKVPSLLVASRRDSFSLPSNASSEDVRKRLRVNYYLEGSVRLTDHLLRVVIHLIHSENGFRVQSRSFSRDRTEFFEIQDEITNLAVANLRVVLPAETQFVLNPPEYPSLDVYMLYRRGVEILDRPVTEASMEAALGWFEQALQLDPDFAAAHAGICSAYSHGFREISDPAYLEKAERSCAGAIERDPNLDVVHIALGNLYSHTGRDREAEFAYQKALEIDANSVEARRGLANVFYREGRVEEAEAMHRQSIGLKPGNWSTYDALGWFLFQNGRYSEAAEQYGKIVSMDSENMQGYSDLGAALMLSGNFEEAIEAFLRANEIQPRRNTYSNLGLMYYYLGRTDDSVTAHKKAIEISPKDHLVWANLGDALAITAKVDEARAAFSKAEELAEVSLTVNPVDAEVLIDMAWIKAMLGKKDEADRAISRAGEIRPGDPYVHFISALIAVRSGDPGSAYIHLQEAIAAGYPPKLIAAEPHLEPVRNEPWFSALTIEPVADNKQNR
jgi:tetratricopeptide (TPR) repeat protein/TolB-like protein/DNA-binding winged helix-turn-helix (wHTH) protein